MDAVTLDGLLGELLYSGKPQVIADLEEPDDDPARDHLASMRSLACAPN